MTRDSVIREVLEMAVAASAAPGRVLSPDPAVRLRDDVGLESLGFIDLIVSVEERYGITLDPAAEDFETAFDSAGSLADLVLRVARTDRP